MLNSKEPIKIAQLQKLAIQLMLNSALVTEIVNNSFMESKNNFGRLIKQGTFLSKKNRDMGSFCYILPKSKLLRSTKEQQSC